MVYVNKETQGELLRARPMNPLERATSDLIFPESTPVTTVLIQDTRAQWESPVFAEVPREYVGKDVRLLQTYLETDAGVLRMQEMYVGDDRVLNTAIVRTENF